MTDEDRLIELLQQHQAGDASVEGDILELVDTYFRRSLRPIVAKVFGTDVVGTAANDGKCRYTEMVNDFFVKVLDKRPDAFWKAKTVIELRKWATVVIKHQMIDFLDRQERGERVLAELAPLVEQKQQYFEERFTISFRDFMRVLTEWESSGDPALIEQATVMRDHYVGGLPWGQIAEQLRISDERLAKIVDAAKARLKRDL